MIYGVYCIRDVQAGYMSPTVDINDNTAKRNFVHAIKATNGIMNSHPHDFELYKIGEFDSESGRVISLTDNRSLMSGSEVQDIEV